MALPWEVARARQNNVPVGIQKLLEQQAQPQSAPKPAPVTNYIQAQMAPAWAVANSRELLPRESAAQDRGSSAGMLAGGIADLLSAPGRFIDSALSSGGDLNKLKANMSDVKTDRGFIRNMVRSPETPVSLIPIGGAGTKIGALMLKSALVGGAAGTVGEMGNYAQTGSFSPLNVAGNAIVGGMIPPALSAASAAVSKIPAITKGLANIVNKAATHSAFAGKTENVQQALTAFNKNPQAILDAAGQEELIGKGVKDAVDQLQGGLIENPIINDAISNMPRINLKNTIFAIKKQMEPEGEAQLEPWKAQINASLEALIKRLENQKIVPEMVNNSGYMLKSEEIPTVKVNTSLPAWETLVKRRDIDSGIDWKNLLKDAADALDQRMAPVRSVMKSDLINAAVETKNPQYVSAMVDYADKLKTADDLLQSAGGRYIRENPEMFVKRLGDENKNITRENLQKLDDLLGSDLSEQARNAIYARWLGLGKGDVKLPIMPQHKTGLGVLNKINIVGNPRVAAMINGFNTNTMPQIISAITPKTDATAAVLNNPKLSKAVQMAIYNLLGAR